MDLFTSCLEKQKKMIELFAECLTQENKYEKLIALGKMQPLLDPLFKKEDFLVKGCQSQVYLHSFLRDGKVFFEAESDAMISAGLAALLTLVYSGEPPEVVLKCPPTYLETLGISSSLTQNRANGLYSIHLKIKQDALRLLIEKERGDIS